MTTPRDDWDDDERALLDGLPDDWDVVRLRHAGDPPLDVLAAADEEALPDAWQQPVRAHLSASAWSRAVLEGAALPDDVLDAATEERMRLRVTRAPGRGLATRWRWGRPLLLGSALAAAVLVAVAIWPRVTIDRRLVEEQSPVQVAASPEPLQPAAEPDAPAVPAVGAVTSSGDPVIAPPPPPPGLPLVRPEVRLALSSMTWRGAGDDNTYLTDLAPAIDAYRAGRDHEAVEAFTALKTQYPDAFEVLFYGGISHLLVHNRGAALSSLEAALEVADEDRRAEALWHLADAELRTGRAAETPATFRARLQALCDMDGPWAARGCEAARAWRDYDARYAAWRAASRTGTGQK